MAFAPHTIETTAALRAALAEVGKGRNVAYITATPREAELARELCAAMSKPVKGSKGRRTLHYGRGAIRFMSATSGPTQLVGWGGAVVFDVGAAIDMRITGRCANVLAEEWKRLADRCNAGSAQAEAS